MKRWEVCKPTMELKTNYLKAPNFFWCPKLLAMEPASYKIIQYFIRNTYGWQKDSYSVDIDQIANDCNMNRKTASSHIQKLLAEGWLEVVSEADSRNGKTREYKLIHGYIDMEA